MTDTFKLTDAFVAAVVAVTAHAKAFPLALVSEPANAAPAVATWPAASTAMGPCVCTT